MTAGETAVSNTGRLQTTGTRDGGAVMAIMHVRV